MCEDDSEFSKCVKSCVGCVNLILLIVAIALVANYHEKIFDTVTIKEYSLTDKMIESTGNYLFCQGLSATSTSLPIAPSNATLYLLTSFPQLTDYESFSVAGTAAFDVFIGYGSISWKFNLNTGSEVSVSACYADSSFEDRGIVFYMYKGLKNFKKGVNNPTCSCAVEEEVLSEDCQTINYRVQQSAMYFFTFYAGTDEETSATLNIEFRIDRTVYHISPDSVFQKCSFPLDGQSGCSVSIPMSSGNTALLSLNTTVPVNHTNSVNIKMHCQPRGWFYAVIIIPAVLLIVATITAVCVCICCKARSRRRRTKYTPLPSSPTVNATTSDCRNDQPRTNSNKSKKSKPPASSGRNEYGATANNE